jgi:hypothetical protein
MGLLVLIGAGTGCAGAARGGAVAPGPPPPSRLGMDDEILPAGLYFRPGHQQGLCPQCRRPEGVALIGLYPTVKAAQKALRAVPAGLLPPGYPWAVTTDDLMLADRRARGIALVAAMVADKFKAARLTKAFRKATGTTLRMAKLADDEEVQRRLGKRTETDAQGDKRPALVQTEPGPPIDAFDETALEENPVAGRSGGGGPAPVCQVEPGALFAFASQHHVYRFGRRYAPALCGDRAVFIPWTRTRVESLVTRRPDGYYQIAQIVGLRCDRPEIDEWGFGPEGRLTRLPKPPPPEGSKARPAGRTAGGKGSKGAAPGGC